MHLITMAHLGEAQGVIDKFKLKKKGQDLFVGTDLVLVLTGEGPFESATKTALTLSQFPITEVINLGIAGTLNTEYKKGEIHPVRSLYLIQDSRPQFKTFQSLDQGLDCLTSFERILEPEKALRLRGLGTLVDREAWGSAMAAKAGQRAFRSYKLISDVAGSIGACELIKNEAEEFSNALAEFLAQNLKKEVTLPSAVDLPGFYFTFSVRHRFENLLNKLSVKEGLSQESALALFPLEALRELKVTPKERTKKLLEFMEEKIDPTKSLLQKRKLEWAKPFEDRGIKLSTDPDWEELAVGISFSASTGQELKEKLSILGTLDLGPFQAIMNGDFHVE